MLGWVAYLDGRAGGAGEAERRGDAVEPYYAKTHYHWALALTKLNRLAEATQHFRQALTIDPKHVGACQGLSHALRLQGQAAEAVRYGRRAARLTQDQNADVLLTLAEA